MDFAILHSNLVSLLQGVSQISKVYTSPTQQPEGYPFAMVQIGETASERLDTAHNLQSVTMHIYVAQEVTQTVTGPQANTILDNAVTATMSALEASSHTTLAGACDFTNPAAGQRSESTSGSGHLVWQEIRIVCNKSVAIA